MITRVPSGAAATALHCSWVERFDAAAHADEQLAETGDERHLVGFSGAAASLSSAAPAQSSSDNQFTLLSRVLGTALHSFTDFNLDLNLSALTYLDVGGNALGDRGADALTKMIRGNRTLHTIDLYFNQITGTGAECIARNISSPLTEDEVPPSSAIGAAPPYSAVPTAITHLRLGWNDLGDFGAQAMARMVASTNFLVALNLAHNDIGPCGGEVLCGAVRHSSSITVCNLSGNGIPLTTIESLDDVLTSNRCDAASATSQS